MDVSLGKALGVPLHQPLKEAMVACAGPGARNSSGTESSQERAAATHLPPVYPSSSPHNPAKNSQERPSRHDETRGH